MSVPENRDQASTGMVHLFVAKVTPPGDLPHDPMVVVGGDIAFSVSYEDVAPLAGRVHREIFMLDQRGSGFSRPSLTCPEVYAITGSIQRGGSWIDGVPLDQFLGAVQACRDRLTDEGVDIAAYDVIEAAADVEDVRVALGVDHWNLLSLGSTSRIAFEVVRRYPEHVRSMVLDSPDVPEIDLFSEAIIGTRDSLASLQETCAADQHCASSYGDLPGKLDEVLAELEANPLSVEVGERVAVLDGATLLRMVRTGMAQTWFVKNMPAGIDFQWKAGGRSFTPDSLTVTELLAEPTLSQGYTSAYDADFDGNPDVPPNEFSNGLQYTTTCRDELPFADRDELRALAAGESWYQKAFVDTIWDELCSIWEVGTSDQSQAEPVISDVPTLFLIGRFDPYSPAEVVESTAAGFSAGFVVEFPHWSHNTLGDDGGCARAIRNPWVDDPASAPDTSCIEALRPMVFTSE